MVVTFVITTQDNLCFDVHDHEIGVAGWQIARCKTIISRQLCSSKCGCRPSKGPLQTSSETSSSSKWNFRRRMGLVKYNAPVEKIIQRSKNPCRAIKALHGEANRCHGRQEVRPSDFSGRVAMRGVKEKGRKYFLAALADGEYRVFGAGVGLRFLRLKSVNLCPWRAPGFHFLLWLWDSIWGSRFLCTLF